MTRVFRILKSGYFYSIANDIKLYKIKRNKIKKTVLIKSKNCAARYYE